jgi:hypothetical protein
LNPGEPGHRFELRFDNYTWCGFFVTAMALLYIGAVAWVFENPGSRDDSAGRGGGGGGGGARQVGLGEMCRHIGRSRCWVNAHCAFVNNFTGQVRTASVESATGAGGENGTGKM